MYQGLYLKFNGNTPEMEVFIMINFTRNYSLDHIRNKLILLYILNVTDIIFTFLLLSTGLFIEANVFMVQAVESVPMSLMLKIILPAVLLIYIHFRMQGATESQLKKSNIFINGAVAFYGLINLSHVFWSIVLILVHLKTYV